MGAIDGKTYGASKKYTDNSIAGGGVIAGKNCTIDSIEPIEGGNRVTFKWTLDNGTVQTSTMDVMDGADGQDGAKGDTGAQGPKGDKGDMGVSVPEGGTTGQHLRKKSNVDYDFEWESIDASLSNVSEGPVQNKVIKEALDAKVNASAIGAAGGIAELDENGKVPSSQLPSYVDDVIEGYYKEADGKFYEEATYETEIAGEDGKIYISLDSNIQYRWTGTVFSALGGALVLGETSTTAYRGDRGKAAYDTAQTVGDVSNLQTTSKTTTVSAINELVGTIASMNIPAGFTPVGTVISVMGNAAPQNYLACNGQTVNIASYPELANYFEAQFGSKNYFGGDGATTFGIPDLRGEFLRGTGTNSHENQGSGANVGTHQDSTEMPWVYGNVSSDATKGAVGIRFASNAAANSSQYIINQDAYIESPGKAKFAIPSTVSLGTSSISNAYAATIRPTNTSVLYCIATKDIYIDARFNYSTDEKVVGTWIDGKPIYQKTVVLDSTAIPNANVTNTAHSISNIAEIVKVEGVIHAASSVGATSIPRVQDNSVAQLIGIDVDATYIYLKGRGANFKTTYDSCVVTIQYTKTTDTTD